MLQAAKTDHLTQAYILVPKAYNSECRNLYFLYILIH